MLLTVSVFHFNYSVIPKVYSGIQTFRRSVQLLPLTISVLHFDCSIIPKVYRGIQTFCRSMPLLPLTISVLHFTTQLSPRLQWHPDVSSECASVAFKNNVLFLLISILNILFLKSGDNLMYINPSTHMCRQTASLVLGFKLYVLVQRLCPDVPSACRSVSVVGVGAAFRC